MSATWSWLKTWNGLEDNDDIFEGDQLVFWLTDGDPLSRGDDHTRYFDPNGFHAPYFCGKCVCGHVEERNGPTNFPQKKAWIHRGTRALTSFLLPCSYPEDNHRFIPLCFSGQIWIMAQKGKWNLRSLISIVIIRFGRNCNEYLLWECPKGRTIESGRDAMSSEVSALISRLIHHQNYTASGTHLLW